jgi:Uma2 family endonuclease
MTLATERRMSLEEYLTYDDGTDTRYELVDGVLVEMGVESTVNSLIAHFLMIYFSGLGLPYYRLGSKQKIEVRSVYVSAREPDLIIHSEDSIQAMKGRREALLKLGEPNPALVIEVVSPGKEDSENYDDLRSVEDHRDYKYKSAEYAQRGIAEYWIVDPSPERAWVKFGTLTGGAYRFATFTGGQLIKSLAFPALALTAGQVLTAGE